MTGILSWPAGSPRILVVDGWWPNAGDALLAEAAEARVRAVHPQAAVLHAAYGGQAIGAARPPVAVTAPLASLLDVDGRWPSRSPVDVGARLAGVDAVLSQGGGFLLERYRPWERLIALAAVADAGIPLALVGQTIGTFDSAMARALLGRTLRRSAVVSVRDMPSRDAAIDMGAAASSVLLAADDAWVYPRGLPEPASRRSGVALILSAHDADPERVQSGTRALARQILEALPGEHVVLVSTVSGLPDVARENDVALMADALAELPGELRRRVTIVAGPTPINELTRVLAQVRLVVSMRLHPGILALRMGIPCVVVSHAQKISAQLGELGLHQAFLEVDIDGAQVASSVDAVLSGRRDDGGLAAGIALGARRAAVNGDAVMRLLTATPAALRMSGSTRRGRAARE